MPNVAALQNIEDVVGYPKSLFYKEEMKENTLDIPIDSFYKRATKQKNTKELSKIKILYPTIYEITNNTLVGIEVEVENIENKVECDPVWTYKEDGSLRNNGIEYVSKPIEAIYAPNILTYLKEQLHEENIPEYTSRTSIHVHINVQDMSFKQIQVFTILYLCFESLLYAYAGKERNKSIFCVPLSHAGYVGNLRAFFSYNDSKTIHFTKFFRSWHKYTGFNLNPIHSFGTIEFRHLPGTEEVEKITHWISIILALKEASLIYKLEDLFKVIAELNTNSEYYIFASNIFKDSLQHLPNVNNLQEMMEKDISHIKECCFPIKQSMFNIKAFQTSYFCTRHHIQKRKKNSSNYEGYSLLELETILRDLYEQFHRATEDALRIVIGAEHTKVRAIISKKKQIDKGV